MLYTPRFWFACFVTTTLGISELHAQPNAADDWPIFRGNSSQTGVADTTLPNVLSVRWTFNTGNTIEGSPVISQQTVFFGTSNGLLLALDLSSGKKKWEYKTAGILATPSVRDGAVYVGDVKGDFHCVDIATGKGRWKLPTGGVICSPANFAQDKILFGSYDTHLYCVSKDGKLLWKCKTKEKLHGAPAVASDQILIAGCDQVLHVVDLATGKDAQPMSLEGHVAASVALRNDHLYVGSMSNQFLAVDWKKGAILWRFEAKKGAQPFFASAAVTDDLVITGGRDKQVRALNRKSGKEIWSFATKGRVDSSPVVAGQRVVVGSLDGHLYVLDLKRGAELAKFDMGPISGSPAVGGQCIVVTTILGDVYCVGAKK